MENTLIFLNLAILILNVGYDILKANVIRLQRFWDSKLDFEGSDQFLNFDCQNLPKIRNRGDSRLPEGNYALPLSPENQEVNI